MPHVASIGTYLPCWGVPVRRVAGDDEDAITMAVEAGRAALTDGGAVERLVLVSRDLPLTESSNAAVLLAGLGLDPELEVVERLGGAPAALDALSSARPRTLIIGADVDPAGGSARLDGGEAKLGPPCGAGAVAVLTAEDGLRIRTAARIARSLPVRTRNAGVVHDYGDPRLLHERGVVASLGAAWVQTPVMLAGLEHARAAEMCSGDPDPLPTIGASSGLFALATLAETRTPGPLLAVEQANLSGIIVAEGPEAPETQVRVHRREPVARPLPDHVSTPGADLPISLAAYERAFEAKVRWEAGKQPGSDELDFPPRYRVGDDCALSTSYELVELPRVGTVYTEVTVQMPVPGLLTPYSLVIVELDDVAVRALVKVTGAPAGGVWIGDRGRMVLRRVAVRSGVPDYGYAFEPFEPAQQPEAVA
ncbi:OB-fold domain-containing protein [[Mycobacterium] crassicus]|uniref:OB-fold domain-containing protein n=1 Tax=[Mycobacterium] crassicus TaxID=2872309 RepID=A0ABU5XE07_9MYCO|nr:OB-fold domain-containing protein [Mycolicibacter sp. MYC098]MEB3019562.1 OB-fold domain-containing protein [Mycolicibacter sp. MYC098]